jgi:hypothetical protein
MNENLKKALDTIGADVIKELTKQLIQQKKKSSGELIDSLDYNTIDVIDGIILNIMANDTLKYVDQGRRKGAKQPPVQGIIPWIKKNNIKIKGVKSVEQTAFVIAKSISKKGIKPTKVIEKTKNNVMKNITELVKKASIEDINQMINEILNTK